MENKGFLLTLKFTKGNTMENENCVLCLESITNPICSDCYLEQINSFLNYIGINPDYSCFIIDLIKKRVYTDSLNSEKCIKCGKTLTICSYCIFFKARIIFQELNLGEDFIEFFQNTFNYAVEEQNQLNNINEEE